MTFFRTCVFVALSLLLVGTARSAISVDATAFGNQGTASRTVATSSFSTTAANELLLAFVSADQVSSSATTVTGITGGGLTWVLVKRTNTQKGTAEIWSAFASSTLSGVTMTATLSQSACSSITVMSFIGVDTSGTNGSGAIGAVGTGNGNPGLPMASLVTTRNGSLVVGVGNDWDNAIGRTVGPGQTLVHQYFPPVGDTYWVQMETSATPLSGTTVTMNDTAPSGDRYNLSIAEILAAGGGTGSNFTVSGTISPATAGTGTTVTLSQGTTTIATTSGTGSGTYSFSNMANGTYTVTPSNSSFSFSPASQSVTVNGANATVPAFNATAVSFTVSGTISPTTAGTGTTVTLSQGTTTIATTSATGSGTYSFSNIANGTYTVTPSNSAFTFSPASQSVTVNGANATVPVFNATALTFTVSGSVSPTTAGTGTTVTLSQGTTTIATISATGSGTYSFSNIANGTYTVTPSNSAFTFSPASQSVTVNGANATVPVFNATAVSFTVSGTISPVTAGTGTTVTLSQGTTTIATTSATGSGTYSFSNISNGTYTVTPSNSSFSFSPTSQSVTVNGANATVPVFNATAVSFTVSGTVSPTTAGTGTTVTLSQGTTTIATTSATGSGTYSFSNIANGTYTVTPSNSAFTFSPASQSVTANGANATVPVFNATAAAFTVSGTISPTSAGPGTTLTLSQGGTTVATATAMSDGTYSFANIANGTYTVTPTNSADTFAPASQSVTVNNGNVAGVSFTAQSNRSGSLAIDVNVSFDTPSATSSLKSPVFSTAAGNELLLVFVATDYRTGTNTSVTNVTGAGLTWAPVKRTNVQSGTAEIWRAFAPSILANISVTATLSQSVESSITVMSFAGVDTSGTNGSGAIGNVGTGNGNPGSPTASLVATRNGSLVLGVGNDWDNAVGRTVGAGQTLVHQYLPPVGDTYWVQMEASATPLSGTTVTINDPAPSGDRYNLSIVEVLPSASAGSTFGVSGTINPIAAGTGTKVTLSQNGATVATTSGTSGGTYTFSNAANGTYTVSPSNGSYSFSPTSQSVTVSGGNATVPVFNASAFSYTVSGTISPAAGGGGATVALNGAASGTTTANSSGAYSFSSLANGTYTVTPSNSGYSFSPTNQAATINGANVTGVNFTASPQPPTFTISGTVSPASVGSGAVMTLSGTAGGTTTADSSGNYAFTGLANGSYIVTPSSPSGSATFSPANQPVTISGGNVPGVNFTATATSNIFFFDDFSGSSLDTTKWTIVQRHGEYAQSETECNTAQQVSVANSQLTITTAVGPETCGDFNTDGSVRHTPQSWPYVTGDVQWTSLNFTYGTVEVRAQFPPQSAGVWPTIWLLGQNCQQTNIYTADTGYSTCPNPGTSGYQEIDMVECDPGGPWCHVVTYNGSVNAETEVCRFGVDTNWHVFTMAWASGSLSLSMDGQAVPGCSVTGSAVPSNPMFLLLQTQTSDYSVFGPPNDAVLPTTFNIDYVKVTQP